MTKVDARAVVAPGAVLHDHVEVGPFAVIEDGVEVGEGTRIHAGAILRSGVSLGARCEVHAGAVLGGPPQDVHFKGEPSHLRVGDETLIREHVTLNRATGEGLATVIGPRCMFMAGSHVGHNCTVGEGVIFANNAALAGHVEVGAKAFISGNTAVHQFTRIGRLAMIGGNAAISRDLLPFCTVRPVAANVVLGLNVVGLRRAGMSSATRAAIRKAFLLIYRSGLLLKEALAELERDPTPEVREIVAFARASRRGLIRRTGRGAVAPAGADVDAEG